ncbi:family 43 glycosylhydrolase [Natrinema salinisoli]|uniref:family 43 glycosylhydrolase n=1 Tax=Natrinema salinisoli TaxID=2878535 RepID=UPI001CF020CF|nr:family 43 glycosylhydrolase [Natrinema salinisoli]
MRDTRTNVDRRDVLRLVGAGTVATASPIGVSETGRAAEQEDSYRNPTGPIGFGDVSVVRTCDGTYYAYGTETPEDVVPIARSTDLVNWTYVGSALERHPDWRDDPDAGVWAPSVAEYDGEYHLYYSYSTWGSQDNPGIGLATASDPEGPFTDRGSVFRAADLGMTNAIDGELVVVDDTPYMVWGSWYGIYGVELTPDAADYVPGTAFHMAGDKKEGPMILEENGYYYLFYSTGHCCDGADSTYEVAVGRSESFFGPYENQRGEDLRELNAHHEGVAVLSGTEEFVGPGHNTAIQDDEGDWWMVYHVEATADREVRALMVDPIRWDDDGWPIVGDDGTPSAEWSVPPAGADRCGDTGDGDTVAVGDYEARDLDDDGRYEDVTGDGTTTHADVNAFFEHLESDGVRKNPEKFDFDGNGRVGFADVLELLREI